MLRFSIRLVRPYWRWLIVVAVAMVVETLMSLAQPWPLKIVLDSVFGSEPVPAFVRWLAGQGDADRCALLNLAVAATVVIALLQAAQRLSQRVLHGQHRPVGGARPAPERLRAPAAALDVVLRPQQIGPIISTITDDINAVQDFVSTSLLDIVIDSLTIVGMVAVMMSLNWRFTTGGARGHAAGADLRLPAARW